MTDANGCEKPSDAITLTQPDAPLAVTGTETNLTCNGEDDGAIDLQLLAELLITLMHGQQMVIYISDCRIDGLDAWYLYSLRY